MSHSLDDLPQSMKDLLIQANLTGDCGIQYAGSNSSLPPSVSAGSLLASPVLAAHPHHFNDTSQSDGGNSSRHSSSVAVSLQSWDVHANARGDRLASELELLARLQEERRRHQREQQHRQQCVQRLNTSDSEHGSASIIAPMPTVAANGSSGTKTPVAEMDRQLRRKLLSKSDSFFAATESAVTNAPTMPPGEQSLSSSTSATGTDSVFGCSQGSFGHAGARQRMLSSRPAFRSRRTISTANTATDQQSPTSLLWTQTVQGKRTSRKAYILFLVGISIGLLGAAALIVTGFLFEAPKNKYCLVMEDNFDKPTLDTSIWRYEQQTGGFGNNEFEWTTDSQNNTYIKDGLLHIVPTLTADTFGEAAVLDGYTLNLTTSGVCTSTDYLQCGVASNASEGVILPPIQSARLTTKGLKSIRYGRVEVRARMPTGDWIWPAIWMMPRDSVYGEWPASGEIDIVESKGNKPKARANQLSNVVRSTLHWGPTTDQDAWWRTTGIAKAWRNFFNQQFYTFGLEWDEDGIYTWQGSRVRKYMAIDFKKPFFDRGNFPPYSNNGTHITNPWGKGTTSSKAAPFDQDFYLIMNVAVGGTNGYFGDDDISSNGSPKPWSNSGKHAARDFWRARSTWLPTWPTDLSQRAMVVDYIKMYQKC